MYRERNKLFIQIDQLSLLLGEFRLLKGTSCVQKDKKIYKNYTTLDEAKKNCKQDDGCIAIHHDHCVDQPTFSLCPNDSNLIRFDDLRNINDPDRDCHPDSYLKPNVPNGKRIPYMI